MTKAYQLTLLTLMTMSIFACEEKIKGPEHVPGENQMASFDEAVSKIVKDLAIDEYSYAIITNSDILKLKEAGIGSEEEIAVGGVSALFMSTLLLQCADEEKLEVNNTLTRYGVDGEAGKAQIKNLLSFTHNATQQSVNVNQSNYLFLPPVLKTVTGENVSDLFASNVARRAKMKNTSLSVTEEKISCSSSLSDLIRFSMAVDNQKLFENENIHNMMFRPVYLETGERTPAGLGCFVTIDDDKKIVWTVGTTEEYSTLFMKSTTDSLSLILVAKAPSLNQPFALETGEIGNTPLYYLFKHKLIPRDSAAAEVNFYKSIPDLRKNIAKALESGKRDDVYNEMTSYLRMYHATDNSSRYEQLAELYREFFPKDIPLNMMFSTPVAKVSASMDYTQYKRTFSIEKNKNITVFATAEFTNQMTLQPWQYDNVEIFFDLNHERSTNFQSDRDDRQYRFNYDFTNVTGNAPSYENIKLVQYDPSPTRYGFEIAIPWEVLFNSDSLKPAFDKKVGFDIAIADNDGAQRDGSLAWSSELDETPWQNTSTYGTVILAKSPGAKVDSIAYAIYRPNAIKIDGQVGNEWNSVPKYAVEKKYAIGEDMPGISGPDDLSGYFQLQWDDVYLYLHFEVRDDVKRLLEKTGDYAWITNSQQDTVWQLTEEISVPSGGDKSNRFLFTEIPLQAGTYTLHYQTNQTHSIGRWTKERPDLSFYGVVAYE